MMKRRKMLGLSATAIGGASFAYAGLVEPARLQVRAETLQIPSLPSAFKGLKIAHLTDFHYRPNWDRKLVERTVVEAITFQPDLIALTGDFIERTPESLKPLLDLLADLKAPLGVSAVLGNHDKAALSNNSLRSTFQQSSIRLLINEVIEFPYKQGHSVQIVGLDSMYTRDARFDLSAPVKEKQLRLTLAHEPDIFPRVIKSYSPHLQLSGHTHGGQCRIPIVNAPLLTPYLGRIYLDGHYVLDESHLFVSTGIGTSGPRLRFACTPEIVLLTLA